MLGCEKQRQGDREMWLHGGRLLGGGEGLHDDDENVQFNEERKKSLQTIFGILFTKWMPIKAMRMTREKKKNENNKLSFALISLCTHGKVHKQRARGQVDKVSQ